MTVIIECISWLINVTDNNDARWKPEINNFKYLINARIMEHSNWTCVYNRKTYQALHMKTSVRFIVADDTKSS